MKAVLIYQHKVTNSHGITEIVIWQLPYKTADRPHGIKYRCYYGDAHGQCMIRYDNELGKGDHKHIGNKEIPYQFESVEKLMQDFIHDIEQLTSVEEEL